MIITDKQIRTAQEIERINGGRRENYRIELYKRYTGKDPAATVYNGFIITRPDGEKIYYTIHYRTDNARPYAVYINGSQVNFIDTYINRGACENALNKLKNYIPTIQPDNIITDITGPEIIT